MKLSPAQKAMLQNALELKSLTSNLVGRSAHGGATWTRKALLDKGLLAPNGIITLSGMAALAALDGIHAR